jgi:16S rRNA processing protein RimM
MKGKHNTVDQKELTGSPMPGEPVFLVIGKLRRPHGLKGDMLMEVLTDFPERIKAGERVFVGEKFEELQFKSCFWHGTLMRISFEGINNPELVGEFRNTYVYVRRDDSPELPEGEYYHHQFIGLKILSDKGESLGVITSILETGANDVLNVMDDRGREVLIPVIGQVIRDVNFDTGTITVHLIPGLIPESRNKSG